MSKNKTELKPLFYGFIGGFGYQLISDLIEKVHHSPVVWFILIAIFALAIVGAVLTGKNIKSDELIKDI